MGTYVYESHLGGYYTSEFLESDDLLYCETCGDYDELVGCYDSFTQFLTVNANDIDVGRGCYGYSLNSIFDWLANSFDNKLTYDEAKQIVLENKTIDEEEE